MIWNFNIHLENTPSAKTQAPYGHLSILPSKTPWHKVGLL